MTQSLPGTWSGDPSGARASHHHRQFEVMGSHVVPGGVRFTVWANYGRYEVRDFLISNALFWLEHYHVDALPVDAVASMLYLDYARQPGEWIPNPHGGHQDLNSAVYANFPDVHMIAEESTAWPGVSRPVHHGGPGFGMKWNMGWMNDTLRYVARPHFFRSWHFDDIRCSAMYAFNENFVLPLSHDELLLTDQPIDLATPSPGVHHARS